MNQFNHVLVLIVSLTLGLGGLHSSAWGMAERPPLLGSQAPLFTLPNLSGEPIKLEALKGKVVLINFWATWCKPCTKEMPAMEAAYHNLKAQGFEVLAINELEDTERVRQHIHSHGHTFSVLMDHDNLVANMYGVVGLPVTIFLDKEGRVREIIKGGLLTEKVIGDTFRKIGNTSSVTSLASSPIL